MDRRHFISSAGFTGYSLMIFASDVDRATAAEVPLEEMKRDFAKIAPEAVTPANVAHEPHMTLVDLDCDLFVAGGGMAGCCAAIAAARNGAKVVIAQDRSRLGGNASSEVKMHIVGADHHGGRPGWREGGLIEEMRIDDGLHNSQNAFEMWDLMLYDKIMSEPNITLLLDSAVYGVEMKDKAIERAFVRSDKTEHVYRIKAHIYADCTGDSRLALEAGAEFRWGRESKSEFGETLGLDVPDKETLGSSILFTSRDYGRPMPFKAPKWARKVKEEQVAKRRISSWEYGYWWIEWGGQINTLRDNERIRYELLSICLGVWDYIKNSGKHPNSANWALDWIGMVPGKRESRRIVGDVMLTQYDLIDPNRDFEDALAIGGWPLDDHPPSGFDKPNLPPCVQIKTPEVYNIPLRSLYSKDVSNLMMAGRNISATHSAFTSTRVMATCAVMGQGLGTAAAACARYKVTPRQLYENKEKLNDVVQTLIRDDQTIRNRKNEDPNDLALKATAKASGHDGDATPDKINNGFVRDIPKKVVNRWSAPMTDEGAWIELDWELPQKISQLQITFDSGFQRELTLSCAAGTQKRQVRGSAQPETVRDFTIQYRRNGVGDWADIAKVDGNYQRLYRHKFEPVTTDAIRVVVRATNGDKLARIFEIRAYA